MKFVDEVTIHVEAGNGGDGCSSFRREKFVERGGPNGGDGGDGGSLYLEADAKINTLIDYRYRRIHRAKNGRSGMGSNMTGPSGEDLILHVPVGTKVYDATTQELIGDLVHAEMRLLVAKGGFHGLGNTRFKSSVNQAPRKFTKGTEGDKRDLRLELNVLADVGLLGMPNAGKSTFIRAVSAARPKVADYPFTTMYPNLGVVRVADYNSFVVADIPGLIEGAASGAGLGVRFLKHLTRTKILLHILDVAPVDGSDPVKNFTIIEKELANYSSELMHKPRWLVLNKIDLLDEAECAARIAAIIASLNWTGPVYQISALRKIGTEQLCLDLMRHIT